MTTRMKYSTAAVGVIVLTLAAGCGANTTHEEPEFYFSGHKPDDYPTAVERIQETHQEILDRPLVEREVHATHHHHDHPHDHDHSHSHEHGHEHAHLDALQEMSDLVRWLPDLAADSDLKEEPWNRVFAAAKSLEAILIEALSQSGEERRATYLQHESDVVRHLRELTEVGRQFERVDHLE